MGEQGLGHLRPELRRPSRRIPAQAASWVSPCSNKYSATGRRRGSRISSGGIEFADSLGR